VRSLPVARSCAGAQLLARRDGRRPGIGRRTRGPVQGHNFSHTRGEPARTGAARLEARAIDGQLLDSTSHVWGWWRLPLTHLDYLTPSEQEQEQEQEQEARRTAAATARPPARGHVRPARTSRRRRRPHGPRGRALAMAASRAEDRPSAHRRRPRGAPSPGERDRAPRSPRGPTHSHPSQDACAAPTAPTPRSYPKRH
jgi:hypothetical protein